MQPLLQQFFGVKLTNHLTQSFHFPVSFLYLIGWCTQQFFVAALCLNLSFSFTQSLPYGTARVSLPRSSLDGGLGFEDKISDTSDSICHVAKAVFNYLVVGWCENLNIYLLKYIYTDFVNKYFITTKESWKLSESLKLRRVFIRSKTCMLISQQCSLASVFWFACQILIKSVLQ